MPAAALAGSLLLLAAAATAATSIGLPTGFAVLPLMDAPGQDLGRPAGAANITLLAALCQQTPECVGFSSSGWLKRSVARPVAAASTLYVLLDRSAATLAAPRPSSTSHRGITGPGKLKIKKERKKENEV